MAQESKFAERHIDFALAHSSRFIPTLTASAALSRCQQLLMDIDSLDELRVNAEQSGQAFGYGWFGFDILSYYAVGFVTCLEWHARSRLVDLLSFEPNAVEIDDLKPINGSLLSQSIKSKASIPLLVGAITKVSDFDRYCGIFARVLKHLNSEQHPKGIVAALEQSAKAEGIADEVHPSLAGMLTELYFFRNHLVHEIDLSIIGPFTLREAWDLRTARNFGQAVQLVIREVEKVITAHAPVDFPNRLDADGHPINRMELLERRAQEIERQLDEAIRKEEDSEVYGAWKTSLAAYAASRAAEESYIEQAEGLAPLRYFDRRAEFRETLLRLRLQYLEALHEEIVGERTIPTITT